jgi:hypothetical protein
LSVKTLPPLAAIAPESAPTNACGSVLPPTEVPTNTISVPDWASATDAQRTVVTQGARRSMDVPGLAGGWRARWRGSVLVVTTSVTHGIAASMHEAARA